MLGRNKVVKRLSGWKRLWIVLAIFYLLPVAFFTIPAMPKEADVKRQWASAAIDIVKSYDESLKNEYTWRILDTYGDMTYEEVVQRIRNKYYDKSKTEKGSLILDIELEAVEKEYKEKLSGLWKEQAKAIGIGILFWVIPLIAIYILGIAVGWIYRGFKADISKQ